MCSDVLHLSNEPRASALVLVRGVQRWLVLDLLPIERGCLLDHLLLAPAVMDAFQALDLSLQGTLRKQANQYLIPV